MAKQKKAPEAAFVPLTEPIAGTVVAPNCGGEVGFIFYIRQDAADRKVPGYERLNDRYLFGEEDEYKTSF